MNNQDIPSSSMIDWISDDMCYLGTLPQKSKDKGDGFYSPLKQAHDTRLLIVFGNAMVEGFTNYVADRIGKDRNITTIGLIKELDYPPEYLTVGSLDQLAVILEGIRNLRDIIAHALTNETARNMSRKCESIRNAQLPINPMELKEEHFTTILKALNDVTNILGAGLVIHNNNER